MLKKYSIIILFLFAYTIVFAHSIIPHHHHDENHHMEQANHHDGDADESLAHEFGNYIHSVNTADVYQKPDVETDNNIIATVYLVATFNFNIHSAQKAPPIVTLSNDCIPLAQHCLSTKGLRAPPFSLS